MGHTLELSQYFENLLEHVIKSQVYLCEKWKSRYTFSVVYIFHERLGEPLVFILELKVCVHWSIVFYFPCTHCLTTTVVLSASSNWLFGFPHGREISSPSTFPGLTFHLAQCPPGSSVLWQMMQCLPFYSWIAPHRTDTTFSLSLPQLGT